MPAPEHIRAASLIKGEETGPVVLLGLPVPDWLSEHADFNPDAHPVRSDVAAIWTAARHREEPGLLLVVGENEEPHEDCPCSYWFLPRPPDDLLSVLLGGRHTVVLADDQHPQFEAWLTTGTPPQELLMTAHFVAGSGGSDALRLLFSAVEAATQAARLPDADDPEVLAALRARLFARVQRATGEFVAENQLLPMAWRPWHLDFLDTLNGVAWVWPVQQVYLGLRAPGDVWPEDLPAPSEDDARTLTGFLETVERLARSMTINQGGSLKMSWSRDTDEIDVQADGPHGDAFDAALVHVRKLTDPTEQSGFSFTQVRNILARAAHTANAQDLGTELKHWKNAEKTLLTTSVTQLQHELVAEMLGDPVETPGLFQASDRTPKELLDIYMYGDVLHVAEGAEQVRTWDADPFLGPTQRMHAREAISSLVHFYGAFATYIHHWLSTGNDNEHANAAGGRQQRDLSP